MWQRLNSRLRRLWPKQFMAQVAMLGAFMITLGIGAASLHTVAQVLEQRHRDTEQRLAAIAHNLAFASAHFLLVRDQGTLEQLLLQTADYPGLRSLSAINSAHRLVSDVKHAPGKSPAATFDYGALDPPPGNTTHYQWRYGAADRGHPLAMGLDATALVVWYPIENGQLGWLRIETAVDDSRAEAMRLVRNHALFAVAAIALSTLALFILLRPRLLAISAATDFARELMQARGQQMALFSGSIELEQLGHALNETSYRLYAQETALNNNTALLQAIFNNVTEGIITWDEHGAIQSANAAAQDIFGHAGGDMHGQPIQAMVPAWGDILVAPHSEARATQQESLGVRGDGARFPLEIAISSFTFNAQRFYIGAVQNISARKMVEAEVRENEMRFRYMLETCPTAARIARAGGREVIFFNSRYAELINAIPGQVSGVDPASYYAHLDDYTDIVRRLQQGEQIFDRLIELNIPGAGTKWALGSYLPIQYEGQAAVLGWFHDITERKRAEEALHASREGLQRLLDAMAEGAYGVDTDGRCTFVNPAFLRMLGFERADAVLGRSIHELIHHSHADGRVYPATECQMYRAYRAHQTVHVTDEVFWRADGVAIPVEYWSSPIVVDRVVTGAICTFIDITERKRVERMKTEFVSTVSHELRTPLTSISGALGLINGGAMGEVPDQAKPLIDIAHKNSLRLTLLINDLLDMEKLVAGKMHFDMQTQPLMPLIQQALETNRTYGAERRVALTLTDTAPDAQVCVDSHRLMQVLSNLISNAIKFSPEGGNVEIAVTAHGELARVTVTDHGPGIPLAFHDRIFQKFSQADSSDTRQKGGTGLGLAITRELIERMHGQIGFDSVEGKGARFYFELPIA